MANWYHNKQLSMKDELGIMKIQADLMEEHLDNRIKNKVKRIAGDLKAGDRKDKIKKRKNKD